MAELAPCPICFMEFETSALTLHVNSHFGHDDPLPDDGGGGAARGGGGSDVIDLTGDSDGDGETPSKRQRVTAGAGAGGFSAEQLGAALAGALAAAAAKPLWARIPLDKLKAVQKREPSGGEADWHPLVSKAMQSQTVKGQAFRASLCAAPLTHFSTREGLDNGWGCGWRNLQMLASHLLAGRGEEADLRRRLLFGGCGYVPDIAACQAWMESAWTAGFDPGHLAHEDFNGGAIQGRSCWIGAVDICAMLRFFGLRAHIVDFKAPPAGAAPAVVERKKAPAVAAAASSKPVVHPGVTCDGCDMYPIVGPRFRNASGANFDLCQCCVEEPGHADQGPFQKLEAPVEYGGVKLAAPTEPDGHAPLASFVWDYFSTDGVTGAPTPLRLGDQIRSSANRPPLFLQHDGHSRTIVGVERRRRTDGQGEDTSLLMFDPGVPSAALREALGAAGKKGVQEWPKLLKRGLATFRKQEYSVLVLHPGEVAKGSLEWEAMKTTVAMEAATALKPPARR